MNPFAGMGETRSQHHERKMRELREWKLEEKTSGQHRLCGDDLYSSGISRLEKRVGSAPTPTKNRILLTCTVAGAIIGSTLGMFFSGKDAFSVVCILAATFCGYEVFGK